MRTLKILSVFITLVALGLSATGCAFPGGYRYPCPPGQCGFDVTGQQGGSSTYGQQYEGAEASCLAEFAQKKAAARAAQTIGDADLRGFSSMEPNDAETQKAIRETVKAGANALAAEAKAGIVACVADKMANYGKPQRQQQPNVIINQPGYGYGGYRPYGYGGYP